MIRALYLRWQVRQLRVAIENVCHAIAAAHDDEAALRADLRRAEAALAIAELDRRYGVPR